MKFRKALLMAGILYASAHSPTEALPLNTVGALNPVKTSSVSDLKPGPSVLLANIVKNANAVAVRLNWARVGGAQSYRLYRDGIQVAASAVPTYLDVSVTNGASYSYSVVAVVDGVATNPSKATSVLVFIPAAPANVTATAKWETSCPVCGGKAMPHIIVAWSPSANVVRYDLYRNGKLLKYGQTSVAYTDMSVVSGTQYSYTVVAVAQSASAISAIAKAVALSAPAVAASMTPLSPPTNLTTLGTWTTGSTDTLAWTPADGAVSYNVYQYGKRIGSGVQGVNFTVPTSVFWGGTSYSVTSVDSMGMESLPSAIAAGCGGNDPLSRPAWTPPAPAVPRNLAGVVEWNGGRPRVHLTWNGATNDATYTIYRDGVKVAEGLWGLNYFDGNLQAGDTHQYSVSSSNVVWMTVIETATTAPIGVGVPAAAPSITVGAVTVTNVAPDDDSALVTFAAVPGAVDYRVYNVANPQSMKYSGGGLSIEMNGINPATGANLVVEAVDELGPFQTMDGMAGPGAMQMDGSMSVAINGQGDPSNIPNVLARSSQFHVDCAAKSLTGPQAFFDNFRNAQPLVQADSINPAIAAANYNDPVAAKNPYVYIREFSNDKWVVRNYWGDMDNTKVFIMGNHFMDTLYDGGTPHTNIPIHNNNATVAMIPKQTADISGGRVLHATFEVDAHFDSRRWCDVLVCPAGDPLIHAAKLEGGLWPTVSGNMFRWEITAEFHQAEEFLSGQLTQLTDTSFYPGNERNGAIKRILWDGTPIFNGTHVDLDKRHTFDLYLSQTHYRLMESGVVVKDANLTTPLPFSTVQLYFLHQLYHTGNDRPELVQYSPSNTYWFNHRPWADERHWDNMGFEVLDQFPN